MKIYLIGYGLVGKEFAKQFLGLNIGQLVAVANSKHVAITPTGIQKASDINFNDSNAFECSKVTEQAKTLGCNVIVECTSSDAIAAMYPEWLNAGISVVTPNKKAFSGSLDLWSALQPFTGSGKNGVFLLHESTVGAGLPIISTLENILRSSDAIESIEGVFSGTLSFLFNEFSPVSSDSKTLQSFSQLLAEAKAMGCTEPDPRADLDGSDVARKVVICARLCNVNVDLKSVPTENLVPEPIWDAATTDEFMRKLPHFDSDFDQRRQEATAKGMVLRYIASADLKAKTAQVGLKAVSKTDPLARLDGSDNMICFKTRNFPKGLIIQGSGAGAAVTSFGILSDLLKLYDIYH